MHIEDITPIEEYDGIYYKRDDLYMPFDDVPLSGGKVRQACSLVLENYEHIRDNCDGLIATSNNIHSPQGIIIARVAKEFGFRSLILYGNTSMKSILKNHPLAAYSAHFGAKINCEAKMGYDNVTQKHLDRMIERGLKCFNVKFGINLTANPDAMMKSIGYQVQNIPDDLDVLVIPCGSCITACGILWGLREYNKIPQKIYLIQISGYLRDNTINKASNAINVEFPEFEFIKDKTYQYSKYVFHSFGGGKLDPMYEGKAHEYMLKHLDIKGKKVLFWIVGDSKPMRDCAMKHHSIIMEPSESLKFMLAEHFSTEVSQAEEVSDDVTKVTPESDYVSKLLELQAIAVELPDGEESDIDAVCNTEEVQFKQDSEETTGMLDSLPVDIEDGVSEIITTSDNTKDELAPKTPLKLSLDEEQKAIFDLESEMKPLFDSYCGYILVTNTRDDYICIDKLDVHNNVKEWARIAIYSDDRSDCNLMLYDGERKERFAGSYVQCVDILKIVILGTGKPVKKREIYKFTEDKTSQIVELLCDAITVGAIRPGRKLGPFPILKRFVKQVAFRATNGYFYLNLRKGRFNTFRNWARIGIHDDKARACSLMIYNSYSKNWDLYAEGSLPQCLTKADSVFNRTERGSDLRTLIELTERKEVKSTTSEYMDKLTEETTNSSESESIHTEQVADIGGHVQAEVTIPNEEVS